ncbi:hypothetical protein HDV00_008055 [Rhizophlyctis rosea]|nr:hypothetical protein HDV00_008055 [Rhizophlyctis rosea]
MPLSPETINTAVTIIRVTGSLSILGCTYIILTYLLSPRFRKPNNRMVMFMAVSDILGHVAEVVSRLSDVLWAGFIALNLVLTMFFRYASYDLGKMEKYYHLVGWGLPFIPSIVFLFLETAEKGPVYGDATLWCWIATPWSPFRIIFFYGPIWAVILFTGCVYIAVGFKVFYTDRHLKKSTNPSVRSTTPSIHHTNDSTIQKSQPLQQPTRITDQRDRRPSGIVRSAVGVEDGIGETKGTITNLGTGKAMLDGSEVKRRGTQKGERVDYKKKYVTQASLYVLAMVVSWVPPSINRIQTVIDPTHPSPFLMILQSIFLPSLGFINFLVYFFSNFRILKQTPLGLWCRDISDKFWGNTPIGKALAPIVLRAGEGIKEPGEAESKVGTSVSDAGVWEGGF